MIEGLVRHDTEMRVEKNFVDSHGQSEVAFAFCHLLGSVRLMPRLKRIKHERLYLPDKGMAESYPNLAGTFARPIRWDLVEQQYDEMVKFSVAIKCGTASTEAILKPAYSFFKTLWLRPARLRMQVSSGSFCVYYPGGNIASPPAHGSRNGSRGRSQRMCCNFVIEPKARDKSEI
jgi:Tn3 transposase DDE domain